MSTNDKPLTEATSEEMRDGFHDKKLQQIECQIGDILGELDHIAKDSTPRNRIRALATKLRHLEWHRHHTEQVQQEEHYKEQLYVEVRDIADGITLWTKQQREIQHAPGHAVTRFSGMGIKIEASGPEDDQHYQQIVNTIKQISTTISNLKEQVVRSDIAERETPET